MDPDYELPECVKQQAKLREENEKKASIDKIKTVINNEFKTELETRQNQLEQIQNRLTRASKTLHLLRYVIVTSYYNRSELQLQQTIQHSEDALKVPENQTRIHPAIKKLLGAKSNLLSTGFAARGIRRKSSRQVKCGLNVVTQESSEGTLKELDTKDVITFIQNNDVLPEKVKDKNSDIGNIVPIRNRIMIKRRVVIGNISKFMPSESVEDNSTHKWMVYVRGPKDNPNIDDFVQKVVFYLHPSYQPNDVIELREPPFHLSRRGWGEFPLRVQIFFHANNNKPVDIIHNLKLDRTYTGRQTLGNETIADLTLYSDKAQDDTNIIPSISDLELIKLKEELQQEVDDKYNYASIRKEIDINSAPILEETEPIVPTVYALSDHNYSLTTINDNDIYRAVKKCIEEENVQMEEMIINSDGKLVVLKKRKRPQESLLKKIIDNKRIKIENGLNTSDENGIDYEKYTFDFNADRFRTAIHALPYLLKRLPLINSLGSNLDYKCTYPYVAESYEEYASWPIEKRMSSEWSRSKKAQKILSSQSSFSTEIMPTKTIIAYSRSHGYTPLTNYNMFRKKSYEDDFLSKPIHNRSLLKPVNKLKEIDYHVDVTEFSEGIETETRKTKMKLVEPVMKSACSFVKQTALDIGVILKPEEIVPGILYNASERIILQSVMCLAENIIRNARALLVYKSDFDENKSMIGIEEIHTVLNNHREEFKSILNFDREAVKY